MNGQQSHINDFTTFMQAEVYASLDDMTKAALVRKKVDCVATIFLRLSAILNRNKFKGCYAPHKAVMIMAVIKLIWQLRLPKYKKTNSVVETTEFPYGIFLCSW